MAGKLRKRFRTYIAALLMLCMVLSCVGCGGDNSNDSELENVQENETDSSNNKLGGETDSKLETEEGSCSLNDTLQVRYDGGETTSTNGFVTSIDVIQVMGKGLDTTTGELFEMTKFVAGKDTIIAVNLKENRYIDQDGSMILSILRDGEDIIELLPMQGGYEGNMVLFTPKNSADIGNWVAGEYQFNFVCDEDTATRSAQFCEAQKIKVLAVPVIANYGGTVVACEGEWKTAIQFTKDTYPIAKDGIEYVLGSELDLSDNMYDLTTEEGQYNVWAALCTLQTPSNDYELILGFVRDRQGADGTTQGYTYGSPANIITESDGDMQPTVAHEIAHCYNVGDEYPGGAINDLVNPAPFGMEGSDYNNRDEQIVSEKQAVVSANDAGNENTGSLVYATQLPFNASQMLTLQNVGSFMGSGSASIEDYWITSDIWNQLYKVFVENYEVESDGTTSQGFTCSECCERSAYEDVIWAGECSECGEFTVLDYNKLPASFTCEECQTDNELTTNNLYAFCPYCSMGYPAANVFSANQKSSKVSGVKQEAPEECYCIDISGTVYESGEFKANPWYGYVSDTSAVTAKQSGEYSVVMYDGNDTMLARQYFDVSFYTQSNPPVKKKFAPVNVTAVVPEGTSRISIAKGENIIYEGVVSANAPEVSFTGITENQKFSGKQKISWNASDADGDPMYYELWYCTEAGDFTAIASNLTQTSYTVDFDQFPGDDAAYLYLYATDGINTSEIDSPWIVVDYKAPEVITEQKTIPEYKITDEIKLDVDVYDIQDGWLWNDDEISWSYKGKEYISGSLLWIYPYEIAPGQQTFTMTAKNSKGITTTKEFTFNIVNDESALPNDWSKDDIRSALTNGFVAPLQNVKSAITRGQFAKLMANLYWNVWEEGSPEPEYEEGVVTDCGNDDYNQYLMVSLGLMEAPDGKFNPNGKLTEAEAIKIIYRVVAISDPSILDDTQDSSVIEASCLDWGVIDSEGDNIFNSENYITGQLALVRCNRLFDIIFSE